VLLVTRQMVAYFCNKTIEGLHISKPCSLSARHIPIAELKDYVVALPDSSSVAHDLKFCRSTLSIVNRIDGLKTH
jgi:hypothetical protein